MFFKKSERKSRSATFILAVGALAAVGAVSITKCGKQMMRCMCTKVKGFFKNPDSMCAQKENQN